MFDPVPVDIVGAPEPEASKLPKADVRVILPPDPLANIPRSDKDLLALLRNIPLFKSLTISIPSCQ